MTTPTDLLRPTLDRWSPQKALTDDEVLEWNWVDFDIETPESYWTTEADSVPSDTQERINRLADYDDLLHGDFRRWLDKDERTVRKNWFADIAMLYADFITSSPPVWYVGDSELRGSGLLPESTLDHIDQAVELVVRDQLQYGVALVDVIDGQVERVHPKTWFPTGGDGDVTAGHIGGRQSAPFVVKHYEPGGIIRREYFDVDRQGRLVEYTGELAPSVETVGQLAAWEVVARETGGRPVPLTACPREPQDGEWGWRIFEDLAPLVFEYVRRQSLRSSSITRHEDPMMVGLPDPDPSAQAMRPKLGQSVTEREQVRMDQLATDLARWRGQYIASLPSGLADLRYVSYEGDYSASTIALAETRRDLTSTSRLPASMLGIEELRLGSGVALRVSQSQTYLTLQNLQESLVKHLRRVILIAAVDEGTSGPVLEAFARELRIEWENPVDRLESGDMTTEEGSEVDDEMSDDELAIMALALEARRMTGDDDDDDDE